MTTKRLTIRQRRQQLAQQTAQCAAWGAEFLAANPAATKRQVLAHIKAKADAKGFDFWALLTAIMALLAQWFGK
jgi:hypothetical protein